MWESKHLVLIALLSCFYLVTSNVLPSIPQCTLDDGRIGYCVIYYQCINDTIIDDGENILTTKRGDCADEDGIPKKCCVTEDVDTTSAGPKCGVRNRDGVGARQSGSSMSGSTFLGELPWSVALFSTDKEQDRQDGNGYFCGGTLIHPNVVLSAAHCFNNRVSDEVLVRMGDWNIHGTDEVRKHQESKVKEIILHEDYYDGNKENNVALLILREPAILKQHIAPICLPNQGALPFAGSTCYTAGWGRDINDIYPSTLSKIKMTITDRAECQEAHRKGIPNPRYKLHETFICASSTVDRCAADGGAPLICNVPGDSKTFLQYGILSWATGCDTAELPAIYASVSKFREWIDKHIAQLKLDNKLYTYSS